MARLFMCKQSYNEQMAHYHFGNEFWSDAYFKRVIADVCGKSGGLPDNTFRFPK